MEQNNNSKEIKKALYLLVGIPAVAVLILLGLLVYEKISDAKNESPINKIEENIDAEDNGKEDASYTYELLKGYYEAKRNIKSYDDEIRLGLDLYKDGTFWLEISHISEPWGIAGNYSIENNNVKLNFLFRTGGECGITSTTGTTTLIFNNNNFILNDKSLIEYFDWNVETEETQVAQINLSKKTSNNFLGQSNKYNSVLEVLSDLNCEIY